MIKYIRKFIYKLPKMEIQKVEPLVLFKRVNHCIEVMLNRPKKLNCLNLEMVKLISAQIPKWNKDEGIKAVIFRGAGPKSFCAGGDMAKIL